MIPHPTTWQAGRERERQRLLASAERGRRAASALAGSTNRFGAARSRHASRWLAVYRTAFAKAVRRPFLPRHRIEPREWRRPGRQAETVRP